jgi:YVTN family beta-propeller protein
MKRFALFASLIALPLAAETVRIIQTNAAGDEVHLIDPATNKVVMRIPGLEVAHGVAAAPDGSRMYFTVEADSSVKAVDAKSGKILWSAKLTGHPNNVAVSADGKHVFAGIAVAPGAVDVIDTATGKNIKSIPVKGAVHNVYTTPDGKYGFSGSASTNIITVFDAKTFEPLWDVNLGAGIRCMTQELAADGSTSRIFVQLSAWHGFVVVDFKAKKEAMRVELPKDPHTGQAHSGTPNHGIGVTPDGKYLLSNSHLAEGVFIYSLPDLKVQGYVKTGFVPDWMTFAPDSKKVYIANAGDNTVSVVDIAARKEIAVIPVGEVPKRNATLVAK